MTAARPTISPSSQWQLITDDVPLTDDMGTPVTITRDNRRAKIRYADSGETAPSLTRLQRVYINWGEYDLIVGEENTYVRPRPESFFGY